MPKRKQKTKKSVRKRFKVTGTGKVLASKAFHRHLLTDRKSKRKRRSRGTQTANPIEAKRVKSCLPYG